MKQRPRPEPKKQRPPRKLTVRQERFAELVASGVPATQAYRQAGYTDAGRIAEAHASRLVDNGGVAARIATLRARAEEKAEFKRDDLVRLLAAAIQTPIAEIGPDSPLCQEFSEDSVVGGSRGKPNRVKSAAGNEKTEEPVVIRRRVKSIGKIEAARLLCEIMQWKSPDRVEIETGPKTLESIRERAGQVSAALDRNARLQRHQEPAPTSRPVGLSRWNQPATD